MKSISHYMRNILTLALLTGALALLLSGTRGAGGQTQTNSLPSPPARAVKPSPQASPTAQPSASPSKDDEILDDIDVVRVESNLVIVPVSVIDAAGQPVQGLTVKDFRLEEEGRVQEIAQIGNPEQVPLEIAILLDVSGSVDARFAFEQQAASSFLKQVLKPADRATIYAIDQTPRLELKRDTAEIAATKIMSIVPAQKATAFYDTVVDAAKYLAQNTPERHRR
ncbi:MAG: hypothetical protein H7Y30_02375, partial [Pyrinomonadaceae bacterium]|nr:hypothetical protein [Pyrinomonadaceae bacterium]